VPLILSDLVHRASHITLYATYSFYYVDFSHQNGELSPTPPERMVRKNQLTFRVSEKIVKMSAVLTIHGHHALHSMMPKLCGRKLQRGSL
jgi:hypothetical protein